LNFCAALLAVCDVADRIERQMLAGSGSGDEHLRNATTTPTELGGGVPPLHLVIRSDLKDGNVEWMPAGSISDDREPYRLVSIERLLDPARDGEWAEQLLGPCEIARTFVCTILTRAILAILLNPELVCIPIQSVLIGINRSRTNFVAFLDESVAYATWPYSDVYDARGKFQVRWWGAVRGSTRVSRTRRGGDGRHRARAACVQSRREPLINPAQRHAMQIGDEPQMLPSGG